MIIKSTGQWNYYFKIAFIALVMSCSDSNNNNPTNTGQEDRNKPFKKTPSNFPDIIVTVDSPAAVFFNPDSLQIEGLKQLIDTGTFRSMMHEFFYQAKNARTVLKKDYPAIKIMEVTKSRFILFKKANGENVRIDLDTKNDPSGLYLFDGKKDPELADMTNIDTVLGFYFNN